MTTVVLGWDGLDHELVARFGLGESFGSGGVRPIETIVNDDLGKPHTWELWPAMITGCRPHTLGVDAAEYVTGGWENPVIRWAATLSAPIPDALRWRVGRLLRSRGATIDFETAEYYADDWTVFDDRDALPIAIPNYRSDADDRYRIAHDRGAELAGLLDTDTDGGATVRSPSVDPETFAGRVTADAARKVSLARHGIDQDRDIIWVWLAYLDTIGHVAPAIEDSEAWLKQHYTRAAEMTARLRAVLSGRMRGGTADHDLICVSDHGLQDGAHTETAAIGAWPDASVVSDVGHVLDVAEAVDAFTPRSQARADGHSQDLTAVDGTRERLEALGYVD